MICHQVATEFTMCQSCRWQYQQSFLQGASVYCSNISWESLVLLWTHLVVYVIHIQELSSTLCARFALFWWRAGIQWAHWVLESSSKSWSSSWFKISWRCYAPYCCCWRSQCTLHSSSYSSESMPHFCRSCCNTENIWYLHGIWANHKWNEEVKIFWMDLLELEYDIMMSVLHFSGWCASGCKNIWGQNCINAFC